MDSKALGIIGPTDVATFLARLRIPYSRFSEAVSSVAQVAVRQGYELIVTPDVGSSSEIFARAYRTAGGKRVVGVFPLDDKEFGYDWLNSQICDRIENCGTWINQEYYLVRHSKNIICLGLSRGVIVELCRMATAWRRRKTRKVYLMKEFIPQELPDYISYSLPLTYLSTNQLKTILSRAGRSTSGCTHSYSDGIS